MITKRGDFMSIQVSTRIDEETKQQFDHVCENIGISPSNALSMFIKSVINYNGIPFNVVTKSEKIPQKLNSNIRPPFVSFDEPDKKVPKPGCMKGKIWMADDFDAPLDDFKEYME